LENLFQNTPSHRAARIFFQHSMFYYELRTAIALSDLV
jgi:hypothetical protein